MADDQSAVTSPIAVGDVVKHADIPRAMSVIEVFEAEGHAGCAWFDAENYEHRGLFALSELERVPGAVNAEHNSHFIPYVSRGYGLLPESAAPAPVADAIQPPSPSEVLYAFAAWLTTREERAGPFSRHNDSASALAIVNRFCESQGYEPPREDYTTRFQPFPND